LIDKYHFSYSYESINIIANITSPVSQITEAISTLVAKINRKIYYMKNLIRILSLLTISVLILTSCEGPMGPAGTNGKDSNASCLKCHTTVNQEAKLAEYHLSKHYYGTSSSRNTKYCARCHTNEGFQEITGAGKYVVSNDMPNATRINCATCHKHTTLDFAVDTLAQILRTTTPVPLNYNKNVIATDFGKIDNLCVTCHQIRGVTAVNYTDALGAVKTFNQLPFFPLDNTKESTTVKYQVGQSFSVHDGNQSNLFAGINAYEYAGQTYTRKWKHSSYNCTDCHMNEYNPTTNTGGHTLIVNIDACAECHNGTDMITIVQTAVDSKRIELAELLVARKVFKKTTSGSGAVSYSAEPTHDFLGTLFPTTASATTYGTALASANTVDPKTGLVIYANTITMAVDADYANRIGREWKYGELGAAYNYGYINSELSLGVHNPTYAIQVLQKSIDWLKANP
jgi:hypothetical protein